MVTPVNLDFSAVMLLMVMMTLVLRIYCTTRARELIAAAPSIKFSCLIFCSRCFYNIYSFINKKKIFALLDSIITYVTK